MGRWSRLPRRPILAALTGSASGGLTIALDTLGPTYMQTGLDPGLMHRVAVIGNTCVKSSPNSGHDHLHEGVK